jgi:polyhydroxybutyrate depolymerase
VLAAAVGIRSWAQNRNTGRIVSSGQQRAYLVHVPKGYDGTKAVPLVISIHGAGGWPAQQMRLSGWNDIADREGFLVVYPSGFERGSPRKWGVPVDGQRERDVQFITDLIDSLGKEYRIDPRRIYADGLSNGGSMAYVLSCTLANRVAAVGMVAAAQVMRWQSCSAARAVPVISFHGTADRIVPYRGGSSSMTRWRFPDVEAWTAGWARRNGCDGNARVTSLAADVTKREYVQCAGDASVVLYNVKDGGHTWPGSEPMPEWFVGRTTASVDATEEIWKFFAAHPLREPARVNEP